MGQITRYSGSENAIRQELTRQINDIQLVTRVANTALAQIGTTHRYAQTTVAQTLHTAQHIIGAAEARQRLTPEQRAAVDWLTRAYLNQMLVLADSAGSEMISLFAHRDW